MKTDFETERYKFYFEQSEDKVLLFVSTIERRDFMDSDVKYVEEFFEDMGKWETLLRSSIDLLGALNIISLDDKIKESLKQEFGQEKYVIKQLEQDYSEPEIRRFRISLSASERHLREARQEGIKLEIREIRQQAENVRKWRNLMTTIRLLSHI